MDKLKEILDKIPNVVWLGLGLVGILLVFKKMIFSLFNFGFGRSYEEKKISKETVTNIENRLITSNLTGSKSSYKAYADALYLKLKGAGTNDFDGMVQVLARMNADELRQVYVSFGVRDGYNLSEWFIGDLSATNWFNPFTSTELQIMNDIWAKAGITF